MLVSPAICPKIQLHVQVWAEDGDSDDWRCVQTLGESNK